MIVAISTTLFIVALWRLFWSNRLLDLNGGNTLIPEMDGAAPDVLKRPISYNTLVVTRANGQGLDDRLAILILQMAVPSFVKGPSILKDVRLLYNRHGVEHELAPRDVPVTVDVGSRKNLNALLVRDGDFANFLCGWTNLTKVIEEGPTRVKGETWQGSAAFIFPEMSLAFIEMSAFRLRFEDKIGNVSIHPLTISEESVKLGPDQVYHLGSFTWNGD